MSNYFPKWIVPMYTSTQNMQRCVKVPVAAYSDARWIFSVFVHFPCSVALWHCVSVSISPRTRAAEHLFVGLLDIWRFSFVKCLLVSLTHFPLAFFCCYLTAGILKHILSLLLNKLMTNSFFHS